MRQTNNRNHKDNLEINNKEIRIQKELNKNLKK